MGPIGRVVRVSGPLVEAEGLGDVAVSELLALGPGELPAEVIAVGEGAVTAQCYEYTGGLAPGHPATALGRSLSAVLGPGLLGGVFDGLLRPLDAAPTFLTPRGVTTADDTAVTTADDTAVTTAVTTAGDTAADRAADTAGRSGRRWRFEPAVSPGDQAGPGTVLGMVPRPPLDHHVLVPPGVTGTVDFVAAPGEYAADDVVAIVDGTGVAMNQEWPVRRPRPCRERSAAPPPLVTGQRVVDLLFPLVVGSSAAVPGGFGTGKTVLLHQIAKWCDTDVIVYVGCGERGNEMADVVADLFELTDPRTGGRLADRTVIIANTSNMPMMAREASVYTAITVAEFFRDCGRNAVVIADSTSRWAEALREFTSRSGALPAEEGYPADLSSALAAFYERAGAVRTLGGRIGSVTVIGAVSPPGGDLTEPVTVHTERFVRARWTLDTELAYARHYPAVSWSGSFSRDIGAVAAQYAANGDPEWSARRAAVAALLADADRVAALAELVGVGALPDDERIAVLAGRLVREGVLQQSALSTVDAFCSAPRTAALVDAVLAVVARCRELIAGGTPASSVETRDFSPLLRAREEAGTPGDVAARRDLVLEVLR
jgi:V/A-type H+-transporting ATPase subunit A